MPSKDEWVDLSLFASSWVNITQSFTSLLLSTFTYIATYRVSRLAQVSIIINMNTTQSNISRESYFCHRALTQFTAGSVVGFK